MQDTPTTKARPDWIHRRVEKCLCGHAVCKDWHVLPEAAIRGVNFTEEQATQVAMLLDMIDREGDKTTAADAATTDVLAQITDVLIDNLSARRRELVAPNTIVMIRADLLSVACLEIESLRKQVREKEDKS